MSNKSLKSIDKIKQGDLIVFSQVAPLSYLKPKDIYCVESISKYSVFFRNVITDGGSWEAINHFNTANFTFDVLPVSLFNHLN